MNLGLYRQKIDEKLNSMQNQIDHINAMQSMVLSDKFENYFNEYDN